MNEDAYPLAIVLDRELKEYKIVPLKSLSERAFSEIHSLVEHVPIDVDKYLAHVIGEGETFHSKDELRDYLSEKSRHLKRVADSLNDLKKKIK